MNRRTFNALLALSTGAASSVFTLSAAAEPVCPAITAGGLTERDFREYIAAFNRNDFESLGRFYANDVIFEGRAGKFTSREAVLNFYRRVKSRVRETLTVHDIILGEEGIAVDLETELHALADWPDFPTGAIRKGDTRRSQNFIWYEARDRKFVRIRSAHYRTL
jgi:hypothetical protein